MNIFSRVFKRINADYYRYRYYAAAKEILGTDPISKGSVPYILLSMVHKRDVLSYLVAAKSFCRFLNPVRIVIICDPTIEEEEKAIFRHHIPHVELRMANEFVHPSVPRGGCWERLLALSRYSSDGYVIQLDADTVTSGDIAEVSSSIEKGNGFVLGEEPNQSLMTLLETSCRANALLTENPHVQTLSEYEMVKVGLGDGSLYVRGCAGFTGFPSDAEMFESAVDFSSRMKSALGDQWAKWGTEQVTSNYLLANSMGAFVLPFPKYCTPDVAVSETVFRHFIGSLRFSNNLYEKSTRDTISNF